MQAYVRIDFYLCFRMKKVALYTYVFWGHIILFVLMSELLIAQTEIYLQTLQIVSNPVNATVSINGHQVGTTPYEINLRPGTYQIKVSLPGFYTYEENLQLQKEDERQVLSLTLKAKPARLTVTTRPDIQVFINDELASKGSFQSELEPGNYSVQFKGELYETVERKIRLLPDMAKTLEIFPEKRFGQLTVKTRPKHATIFLNGKRVGESNIDIEEVRVDTNLIEAVLPGYNLEKRSVLVKNTRTTVVKIRLEKSEFNLEEDREDYLTDMENGVVEPLTDKQQKRRDKRSEVHNPLSWKYHAFSLSGVLAITGYGVEAAYLNKIGGYVMFTKGQPASPSALIPDNLKSIGGGFLIREGTFGKRNRGAVYLLLGAGIEQSNFGHYFELGQYVNFGFVTASFGVSRMYFDYNPSYFPNNDEIKIRVGLGVSF